MSSVWRKRVLRTVLNFLGGGIVKQVGNVVTKTITGDKVEAERHTHAENTALRAQVAAEAAAAINYRTPWDSFVDGLNRLVRPLFTFGVLYLFIWCARDPASFAASMEALRLMPSAGWAVLGTIVAFWFGTRTIKDFKGATVPVDSVKEVLGNVKEFKKMAAEVDDVPAHKLAGLPSIVAWRSRQNA